jgi:hypothetical protein
MERQIYVALTNSDSQEIGILNLGVVKVNHSEIETECKLETELIQQLISKIAPVALRQTYGTVCKVEAFEVFDQTPVNFTMKIQIGEDNDKDRSFDTIFVNEVGVYSINDVPKEVNEGEKSFLITDGIGDTVAVVHASNSDELNLEVVKAINLDGGMSDDTLDATDLDMDFLEMEDIKSGDFPHEFTVVLPTGNWNYVIKRLN